MKNSKLRIKQIKDFLNKKMDAIHGDTLYSALELSPADVKKLSNDFKVKKDLFGYWEFKRIKKS